MVIRTNCFAVALSALIAIMLVLPASASSWEDSKTTIANTEIDGVLAAVVDEIYTFGYQRDFWAFETSGPNGPVARFKVYVRPTLEPVASCKNCREGVVIYKYLPFGEVFRPFIIDALGDITLIGSPKAGFSWNKPPGLTIYMDDDDVIRDKQQWVAAWLSFALEPSSTEVKSAVKRYNSGHGVSRAREIK